MLNTIRVAGKMAGDSMLAIGGGSLALTMVMTFALNYLWGMINAMQMAVHLPVFSL